MVGKEVKGSEVKGSEVKEERKTISPAASAEPATSLSQPAILLPLNDGGEFPIFRAKVDEWTTLYPAVDVMQELRHMRGWLLENRSKRKTKHGIGRFIVAWLSREQDSNRASIGSSTAKAPPIPIQGKREVPVLEPEP